MAFLAPLFLALSALAIPIVLLYMLKLRRRDLPVSSTMLWQMVLRDREANAPWQKLRRNLLLLLQLLLLALLVLALGRPFLPVPVVATGQVIVLLDASVSMQATDVSGSRFEVGRAAALDLINGLDENSRMTIIAVGAQPDVLISGSGDQEALRAALAGAAAEFSAADWRGALTLAASAAGESADPTIVIISDGGLPDDLPVVPGSVRYVPVGQSAENVGIAAMSVRPDPAGPQLFVRLENYGAQIANPVLTIYLGDLLYQARQVDLEPGGSEGIVWTLPEGVEVVRAELSAAAANPSADYLAADDVAWAVYTTPQTGRVLYIAERNNLFIEQVLAALPGVEAFRGTAGNELPSDPFDLYIFDNVWPVEGALPEQEVLLVNPPANDLFIVGEVYEPTSDGVISLDEDSPLNVFVDWGLVSFLRVKQTQLPEWATVDAAIDDVPLLFSGTLNRQRVAVLTFDPRDSDMPLQVAFPILFANLLDWLTPGTAIQGSADVLRVGDPVTILPDVDASGLAIAAPNGRIFTTPVTELGAVFTGTTAPGVYVVSDNQGVVGQFAVNVFLADESSIAPVEQIVIGQDPLAAAEADALGQREFWPWLAAAAVALLVLEWWAFHRRGTMPSVAGWRGCFQRRQVGR